MLICVFVYLLGCKFLFLCFVLIFWFLDQRVVKNVTVLRVCMFRYLFVRVSVSVNLFVSEGAYICALEALAHYTCMCVRAGVHVSMYLFIHAHKRKRRT